MNLTGGLCRIESPASAKRTETGENVTIAEENCHATGEHVTANETYCKRKLLQKKNTTGKENYNWVRRLPATSETTVKVKCCRGLGL